MKKRPITPRSRVKQALRQLSLRSRERVAALKRDNYTCVICGAKQSRSRGKEVKVEAHHVNGVDWEGLIDHVYETLLCSPDHLQTLCEKCHAKMGDKGIPKHATKSPHLSVVEFLEGDPYKTIKARKKCTRTKI